MSQESPKESPEDSSAPLAGDLAKGERLAGRLRVEADGTVTLYSGKVEIGQGINAALAQIVADELDLPFDRVRVAPVDTAHSPDEGTTSGSRSIEDSGEALRQAAAEVRAALLDRAAARFDLPGASLTLELGVIRAPSGASVGYGELAIPPALAASGEARPKSPERRRLIGTNAPRRDLYAKVTGAPAYVQDLELPGMLHGRVVRPPGYGAVLRDVDEAALRREPGVVTVVRDGSFLGLITEREDQAVRALPRARRAATWDERPALPATADPRYLLAEPSDSVDSVVHERRDAPAFERTEILSADYSRPFIAHGAIGPSCAVARFDDDGRYTVWAHGQGVFALRGEIARVLGIPPALVRVIHMEGAGCYGHNGADDVALDAALLARAVPGRPVRVQWMRDDEFAWEPYGTAMVVRLSASLDPSGGIVEWSQDGWGHGHGNRPSPRRDDGKASLLAAGYLAQPFAESAPGPARTPADGSKRNAAPLYIFPNERVVDHHVPRSPLRVSALRSLGAHANVFAIESFLDEIAAVSGADPIELRLRYLRDERARAVIAAVARHAGWRPGEKGDGVRGRGIGFARYKNKAAYFAVIVEVELAQEIRVRRAWAAVDAGMVVSRDGLLNQAEGGIIQATSWTLHEAVRTEGGRIATQGWDTYRTLRFPEAPEVDVVLLDRPAEPPLGAGEAYAGPTSAAIANAIFNAAGVRLRDMPFTRERLIAAMAGPD